MRGWIRSISRFFYFAIATIYSLTRYYLSIWTGQDKVVVSDRIRKRWLDHVPARLGLRLEVHGHAQPGTCLYVSNHTSYIDPVLIFMYAHANVVAKAEVSKWPLVGAAASIIGTIFVKREEKSSRLETAQAIELALRQGISILVFPEGTTTDGKSVLPFRPRSFLAAQQAGVPVQPISLSYDDPDVAFINDHTFVSHFFRLFRKKEIHATLSFGPVMHGPNVGDEAREWIARQIGTVMIKSPTDELA